jgi:equilibrative nucleoside transporter 1/2/3
MMSGQAAVAVAVSGVQVVSAAASVWGKPRSFESDGTAEERSAFMFFSLSTLFLIVSAVAHAWMVRMPVYEHVAAPLEKERKRIGGDAHEDERHGLISTGLGNSFAQEKANVLRIAKLNISYEVAVACVFMVTLVRFPRLLSR